MATSPAAADDSTTAEIPLLEARFPNKRSGRAFLYDIKIVLSVKKESADKVKAIVAEHDALIQDRVRTIIAESDPDKLGGGAEPGLETLRRQVKYQLDEIVGDGLIDDVLIPQCLPFPADIITVRANCRPHLIAKDGDTWQNSPPPPKARPQPPAESRTDRASPPSPSPLPRSRLHLPKQPPPRPTPAPRRLPAEAPAETIAAAPLTPTARR